MAEKPTVGYIGAGNQRDVFGVNGIMAGLEVQFSWPRFFFYKQAPSGSQTQTPSSKDPASKLVRLLLEDISRTS